MVSVAELKERFAVLPVQDLDRCIVIPTCEVKPGWLLDILREGCSYEFDNLDGEPVVLVPVGADAELKGRRPLLEAAIQ